MTSIIPIDSSQNRYANNSLFVLSSHQDIILDGKAVLSKLTYHDSPPLIAKIAQVALAALVTLLTLGLSLCLQQGRLLWISALAQFKEHVVYQKVVQNPTVLVSQPIIAPPTPLSAPVSTNQNVKPPVIATALTPPFTTAITNPTIIQHKQTPSIIPAPPLPLFGPMFKSSSTAPSPVAPPVTLVSLPPPAIQSKPTPTILEMTKERIANILKANPDWKDKVDTWDGIFSSADKFLLLNMFQTRKLLLLARGYGTEKHSIPFVDVSYTTTIVDATEALKVLKNKSEILS